MLRFGIITEVVPADGTARVKFDDDGTVSPPLRPVFMGSKGMLAYFPFAQDTAVAVIMQEDGNDGVILGAIYTEEDPTDTTANDKSISWVFPDGTKVAFDWDAKTFNINGSSDLVINATAKTVNITADVKVTGKLEVTGAVTLDDKLDVSGAGKFSSTLNATGIIKSDVDVQASVTNTSLKTHVHAVTAVGSPTGPPTP